jgi:hypothetical protein
VGRPSDVTAIAIRRVYPTHASIMTITTDSSCFRPWKLPNKHCPSVRVQLVSPQCSFPCSRARFIASSRAPSTVVPCAAECVSSSVRSAVASRCMSRCTVKGLRAPGRCVATSAAFCRRSGRALADQAFASTTLRMLARTFICWCEHAIATRFKPFCGLSQESWRESSPERGGGDPPRVEDSGARSPGHESSRGGANTGRCGTTSFAMKSKARRARGFARHSNEGHSRATSCTDRSLDQ